tara:strand:- start:162 stop:350 length:189 start_codon:yes stop_codon:yes gene_type:complete
VVASVSLSVCSDGGKIKRLLVFDWRLIKTVTKIYILYYQLVIGILEQGLNKSLVECAVYQAV